MYDRKQIKDLVGDKTWVSPYERISAVADQEQGLVQIYEDHSRGTCYGGAAWEVFHYKRTSSLAIDIWRDGARNIFLLKKGKGELNLIPSLASAGIEEVDINEKNISVTYAGLAGAGVAVAMARGLAPGPKGIDILEEGGGSTMGRAKLHFPFKEKITVGLDDTDSKGKGATWGLANEIGYMLDQEAGVDYLNHTIVQLYHKAPTKTTNCVSIALTFGVLPDQVDWLQEKVIKILRKETESDQTGVAFQRGIGVSPSIMEFSERTRNQIVTVEDARKAIKDDVRTSAHAITGEIGIIGSVAALGLAEMTDEAVVPATTE